MSVFFCIVYRCSYLLYNNNIDYYHKTIKTLVPRGLNDLYYNIDTCATLLWISIIINSSVYNYAKVNVCT